jgi:hypothetical protein
LRIVVFVAGLWQVEKAVCIEVTVIRSAVFLFLVEAEGF